MKKCPYCSEFESVDETELDRHLNEVHPEKELGLSKEFLEALNDKGSKLKLVISAAEVSASLVVVSPGIALTNWEENFKKVLKVMEEAIEEDSVDIKELMSVIHNVEGG